MDDIGLEKIYSVVPIHTFQTSIEYYTHITGNHTHAAVINWKTWKPRVYRNGQSKALEEEIYYGMNVNLSNDLIKNTVMYEANASLTFDWNDWFTKKGVARKIDLSNIWKPLEDSIKLRLGIDDSKCFKITLVKNIRERTDKLVSVTPPYIIQLEIILYGYK